jgi:hypothetical protein
MWEGKSPGSDAGAFLVSGRGLKSARPRASGLGRGRRGPGGRAEAAKVAAQAHSTTASTMASTPGGISRPSAFAVVRLVTGFQIWSAAQPKDSCSAIVEHFARPRIAPLCARSHSFYHVVMNPISTLLISTSHLIAEPRTSLRQRSRSTDRSLIERSTQCSPTGCDDNRRSPGHRHT